MLSEIGKEKANTSPAIIGLAEIENKTVLEDLIHSEKLKNKQYNLTQNNQSYSKTCHQTEKHKKPLLVLKD